MGLKVKRVVALVASAAVAAAVNVTTGMLTQHWALAWCGATAVLIVIGAGLQLGLSTMGSSSVASQRVSRTRVGGSVHQLLPRPGEQWVTNCEITGDITQSQGHGGRRAARRMSRSQGSADDTA
jgi:hypothetical protein